MLFENGTPHGNSSRMKVDASELKPLLSIPVMEMFQAAIDSNNIDQINEALTTLGLQDLGLLGSRGHVYSCAVLAEYLNDLLQCDGTMLDYQYRVFPRTMGLRQAIINATKKEA